MKIINFSNDRHSKNKRKKTGKSRTWFKMKGMQSYGSVLAVCQYFRPQQQHRTQCIVPKKYLIIQFDKNKLNIEVLKFNKSNIMIIDGNTGIEVSIKGIKIVYFFMGALLLTIKIFRRIAKFDVSPMCGNMIFL